MLKHLVALTWVRLRNQRFRTYLIFFYGKFRQVETPLCILIMKTPIISIIMGSKSDWATMQKTAEVLDNFGIAYEKKVVSAHPTPDLMFKHAEEARGRGIKIIIAGAGGAAHLPGMVAAKTTLPVIGVPVKSRALSGLDLLYSIVQMPGGVPVATMAIGEAGATNAALTALRILSIEDQNLADALAHFHEEQGKIAEESSGELI
ncbi:phosphoribosylaminoimidazole carboxylase catalytic subunit [Streptococcus pyogenes]|nr:N5-carboxyaminoimidazole ribonucleotide mutase [Streptococcus pyogenes]VHI32155.1 phosphoribosylaminoimidazole carboxylase catalytic subunit [Streptococcus pyogenes]VHI37221.1 phosphoribosylaminoimidazole carboxylase catalytic subunit [Streptococcus pyogenes]VHI38068.1 phosphoribosylaminoimidazole carboxylase catalytic subunit [Streptococcus pyogenes]VHI44231.1 phosphoribosylaminoimidazole carboxylase catalytic subunit [Streptococcus pyogenes]